MNEQNENGLIPIVGRLCQIVGHLNSLVDQLAASEVDIPNQLQLSDGEGVEAEAFRVRNERIRLIEAWETLEAEQRKTALQSPEAAAPIRNAASISTNTKHANGVPTITVNPPVPTDRLAQFEFLRSEYDRIRGLESSRE